MSKAYYLRVPMVDGVVRRAVKSIRSRLDLEEFTQKYGQYYNFSDSLRVTGSISEFQTWLQLIEQQRGSALIHVSCIDNVSCCVHYFETSGDYNSGDQRKKRYAALWGYGLVK